MASRSAVSIFGLIALTVSAGSAQTPSPPKAGPSDKSQAYYNFALGHLYAELAGAYGNRGDYLNKAIEHYKLAMKFDPDTTFLLEELTELYVQSGQIRTAVLETEEVIRQNPGNLQARRMLGRIYARLIGDSQSNKINEESVKKAIEQYQYITSKDAADVDSWITLGRLYRVSQNSVDAQKAFQKAIEIDANNEDALTGLAMVYSDIGDTKNMVETLRKVADRSPNLRTLTSLASAYEQMRDYTQAAEIFRRALALNPGNIQVKRSLAQNLLFSDKLDEALKLYLEVAEGDPKDAQVQLRIGEIYRQKRNFAEARKAMDKAKSLDGGNLEVRYDEVSLLEAEGKTDEAIESLRKILDETKKSSYSNSEKGTRAMLLERLGALYRAAFQYDKAVETFRLIAELAPETTSRVSIHVIETYRQSKNFAGAEKEAKAALAKFPDDRTLKVVYGTLAADLGRADEGAALVKTLLGGERDRETYLTLAQVYEKGKNFAGMEEALNAAQKLSESKADLEAVYFMRGAMFEKTKNFSKAEAEFRKILEGNPESAGALNYLGYMLADRNERLDEAKNLIRKALDLDPQNGAYLDSLGWVHYRLGQFDEAERNLRRSLERTAGDPTVHDHLGDVLFKQGKIREAAAQWQLSLKEWDSSPKADTDPAEVAKVTKKLESARVRLARESGSSDKKER